MRKIWLFCWLACIPLRAETVLSSYECARPSQPDEGTARNVELACRLVDGKTVGPGEVFSFYRCLSSGAGMWQPGRTIRDGRYILSQGGGYCQVSTALYNAALLAGLLVVERYPHSFYDEKEAYAPAGFDAAVSRENGADFQFVNSRAVPVALRVSCQPGRVRAEVMGKGGQKRRWVSAEILEKKPKKTIVRQNLGLAEGDRRVRQIGYDGLKINRFLHELDADGNTRTFSLGTDAYGMVPEIIETGPSRPDQGGK